MRYSDNYLNKEFIEQMNRMQEIENMINSPALQEALDIVNSPAIQHAYQSASLVNSINSPISTVLGNYNMQLKGILE